MYRARKRSRPAPEINLRGVWLSMKTFLTIGICLLAFAAAASAEKMYVNDKIRITVRTGPGIDFKVMDEAESGDSMDVKETREGWSRVALEDGKQGWVLSRFLTTVAPTGEKLKALQEAHDALTAELAALKREREALSEENQRLELLSGESRRALEEMAHSYDTLKTESKDFLKVKSDYETASRRFEEEKAAAEALQARMENLEWRKNAAFFIGGGALVLLGFLIGASSRGGSRRRSPFI